jgi:hypothetical protein
MSQAVVCCQEMAVIRGGEGLSRTAGIHERLVYKREGEGPPRAAGVRWEIAEIWGRGGAAPRCRKVA